MHMISKKDLSDAEMDTLTKSCSPTIVITATGAVQTHEEAIVYVKELDIFLTMKVLDNTPAVLSLGKLCDENGYSFEWINGQKPHLIKDGIRIICNTENFVPIVVPGLSSSSSGSSSNVTDTCETRESFFFIFFILTFFTYRRRNSGSRKGRCTLAVTSLQCQVDDEIPLQGGSHASSSHEVSLEPTSKRREGLGKHNVHTHFSSRPKLRDLQADQNYKGPMQETQWRSRTSSRKFR